MATTYTLISSNVLSSSAASVTFSSIPSTYTDLVLRISARGDRAASNTDYIRLRFNGSTANYSRTLLTGNGASASSTNQSGAGALENPDAIPAANTTSNVFGSDEIYIPNYTLTANKPLSQFSATENNGTTAYITAWAGLSTNTAAITQIDILTGFSNFVSGSSFYLYGIKNS